MSQHQQTTYYKQDSCAAGLCCHREVLINHRLPQLLNTSFFHQQAES